KTKPWLRTANWQTGGTRRHALLPILIADGSRSETAGHGAVRALLHLSEPVTARRRRGCKGRYERPDQSAGAPVNVDRDQQVCVVHGRCSDIAMRGTCPSSGGGVGEVHGVAVKR